MPRPGTSDGTSSSRGTTNDTAPYHGTAGGAADPFHEASDGIVYPCREAVVGTARSLGVYEGSARLSGAYDGV